MRITLTSILILVFAGNGHAQSQADQNRAMAAYMQAAEAFRNERYDETLKDLARTEELLGESNARIESLRVKALYQAERYGAANAAVKRFFGMKATPELVLEMAKLEEIIVEKHAKELARAKIANEKARREKAALEAKLAKKKAARAERAKLTADQIIQSHLDAIDAGEKRHSVRTMMESFSRRVEGLDSKTQAVRYNVAPDLVRIDTNATYGTVSVSTIVVCLSGKCWYKDKSGGGIWISMDSSVTTTVDLTYQLAPMAYQVDNEKSVTYQGETELDGKPYFVFSATGITDQVAASRYYVDVDTYLLYKTEFDYTEAANFQTMTIEQFYSDYREVDGILYPFQRRSHSFGTISSGEEFDTTTNTVTDDLQLNPELEDSLFPTPQA